MDGAWSGGSRPAPTPTTRARSLALGYVPAGLDRDGATFEIEIIGQRRPARLLTEPTFDPAGERMRA